MELKPNRFAAKIGYDLEDAFPGQKYVGQSRARVRDRRRDC